MAEEEKVVSTPRSSFSPLGRQGGGEGSFMA